MDPQIAENHTSQLSTFFVIKKILTYKSPHRFVTAENATLATIDDLNQTIGGRDWMSVKYMDTSPQRANEKAKDLIAEYEAEHEDNELSTFHTYLNQLHPETSRSKERMESERYNYIVIEIIINFDIPFSRSGIACEFHPAMLGSVGTNETEIGRELFPSDTYFNLAQAQARAREVDDAYITGKTGCGSNWGMRMGLTTWNVTITANGDERCEVQVIKQLSGGSM
ncbi:MAG: hypothetical protein Q9201_002087 [Fulgogasparrea decipioides]